MKRYTALTIAALLFTVLLFGCTNNAQPEEPTTTAAPTAVTPVRPIDPDNPLIGAWVTQEGGSVFTREGRGFAMLEFFDDHTGALGCGYFGFDFTWQAVGDELRILDELPQDVRQMCEIDHVLRITDSPIQSAYAMELDGNELRLDGILFVRYR